MEIILRSLLKVFMTIIPFIAKRVYPQQAFENDLDFTVDPESQLTVDLNEENPAIRFHAKISNNSEYLEVTFDRAIYSIALNAQYHYSVVRQAYLLRKDIIHRKQNLSFYIDYPLNPTEANAARRAMANASHCEAIVGIEYYIESKCYRFWKRQERRSSAKVVNYRLSAT